MNSSKPGPNVVAIVQARVGSIRMPAKVMGESIGIPLIVHLLARLRRSALVGEIVVAIPSSKVNDELAKTATSEGVSVFRGSELDVLDRFRQAALKFPAEAYIRITGDCPLVDPAVVDELVELFFNQGLDYASTGNSFPDGFDVEIFRAEKLFEAAENARENFDREHVTPYIKRVSGQNSAQLDYRVDLSSIRLTVDEPADFSVVDTVLRHFGVNDFGIDDVASLVRTNPEIFASNSHFERNAGSKMSSGEKLWERAKRVIPGGGMLLSKRAELFSRSGWPTYFTRTKGCQVWDLDGVRFEDLGYMGIGTNILGYSHPSVDEAVMAVVKKGNLSTLNAPEEVYLAEQLIDMHSWSDQARFTRSGGEAGAVAIRIARAASGKEKIAFCGYHGWHDWYLSANLSSEDALDGHLLPGLLVEGVPKSLGGTAIPFPYNDLGALEQIFSEQDVGVVMMEVERSVAPHPGYLEKVRELSTRNGAVLIFDECTSGFRRDFGGLHLGYGVDPDLAIFGKTLGNGYAVNAVIGRGEVMSAANSTFISSTFWTERIGSAAALASLEVMKRENSAAEVHEIGGRVREIWRCLGERHGLSMQFRGLPALSTFEIDEFSHTHLKTFITAEMLKRGFLASTALYASTAHTPKILSRYSEALDDVMRMLALLGPEGVMQTVSGALADPGFGRMN